MEEFALEDLDFIDEEYHSYLLRKIIFIAVCIVGCIVVIGLALSTNALDLTPLESLEYLFNHILGKKYEPGTSEWLNDYLLWGTYTPRIAMAIICGCGLALCGVVMQSVLANPLADPYTTGVSDGACLGATLAIITGFTYASVASSMGIVVNAFIGAIVPALIIIALSSVIRMTPATTILVGVALSNVFGGLQTLINYVADPDALAQALRWGIGTFTYVSWSDCRIPFIITLVGGIVTMLIYRQLNILTLGEKSAKSLGVDVDLVKTVCLVMVSIVAAGMICFVGIIGFVGLICPHIVRMVIGGDNKFVLPASMALGSLLLLASDLISRVLISPDELRVGLIMSVIGAPMFLYVVLRRRGGYGGVY